jgi:hypothetical protein
VEKWETGLYSEGKILSSKCPMKKRLPISADKIIEHVEKEYQSSLFFTEAKRQLYKKRKMLYMNIEDQDKKIYSRLIFSTIETLLALYVKS